MKLQELHKVVREINTHGMSYDVKREELDSYREPTGTMKRIATIKALYHETKGYVKKTVGDSSTIQSKGQPMLLAEWEKAKDVSQNDIISINDSEYRVTGKTDVAGYHVIVDISLEVVTNVNQS